MGRVQSWILRVCVSFTVDLLKSTTIAYVIHRYSKYVIMHMNRVENLWGIVSQKIRIAKEACRKEAHTVVVAQCCAGGWKYQYRQWWWNPFLDKQLEWSSLGMMDTKCLQPPHKGPYLLRTSFQIISVDYNTSSVELWFESRYGRGNPPNTILLVISWWIMIMMFVTI